MSGFLEIIGGLALFVLFGALFGLACVGWEELRCRAILLQIRLAP